MFYRPMPSPRGTNFERLFIPVRGLAYDSANGLEGDPDPKVAAAMKIIDLVKGQVDPTTLAELTNLLDSLVPGSGLVGDDPPDFPGKPNVGGKLTAQDQALDAVLSQRDRAAKSYAEMFPDAVRIGGV